MTAKKKPAEQAVTIQLVEAEDGPRADSRAISQHMGIDHRSTVSLIRRYQDEMAKIGEVRFEIASQRSGQKSTYALLNEEQTAFLMMLSRNTPRNVEVKQALAAAFVKARRRNSVAGFTGNSIWNRAMNAEIREAESAAMASAASYILLERKVFKPQSQNACLVLRNEMQMVIPMFTEEELKAVQRVRRSNAKKLMNGGSNA